MTWRVFAATTTGEAHALQGQPGQDAFAYQQQGDVLCAVVCDGAGSAPQGRDGARFVAEQSAKLVLEAFGPALPALSLSEVRQVIERVIDEVRDGIAVRAAETGALTSDYATTLVGVLCSGEGGWVFHIGDGVAVLQARALEMAPIVSRPENGEYCNETYFVTGDDWRSHLRLTPAHVPLCSVMLMSDGASAFAMSRGGAAPSPGFVDPVTRYLAQVSIDVGNRALQATLDDPRTRQITADDKTLVIAQYLPDELTLPADPVAHDP